MADTVQRLLEDMVPELEDLQAKQIFNKTEIQSIVAARQGHEYKLRRKHISKLDFLRYIQYELNVTALVERRKVRLDIEKKGVCDFSAMRRLAFLYERALRKFNTDVGLWKQYLEYCRRTGSHHAISKILPRALQFNPKDESLWILNAVWESEQQGNAEGSRTVLQRALRLNPNSKPLWLAFHKMEVRNIVKMMERRRALGLTVSLEDEAKEGAEGAEGEAGGFDLRFNGGAAGVVAGAGAPPVAAPASKPRSAASLGAKQLQALTSLVLPRAVARNAYASHPLKADLGFRLAFLSNLPCAYSAALSALPSPPSSEGEASSNPEHVSLAHAAYNHPAHDILLTNFVKFNEDSPEETKEGDAKENGAEAMETDESAAASSVSAASTPATKPQHPKGSYSVHFLPHIFELLASLPRDFPHEVHVVRLRGEWAYTKARVGGAGETEALRAGAEVFEAALKPDALASMTAAAAQYLQANRVGLEADRSESGLRRLAALRDPLPALWGIYVGFVQGLMTLSPSPEARALLEGLYLRARAVQGVDPVSLALGQAEFVLQSASSGAEGGGAGKAREILDSALASSSASSTSSASAKASASLALWNRRIDLEEASQAFGAAAGAGKGESRKRKSVAASASAAAASNTTVESLCQRAMKAVGVDDRFVVGMRLVGVAQSALASATASAAPARVKSAYLAVHRAFHSLLTLVPQPRRGAEAKRAYLEWMASVAGSEGYALIRSQKSAPAAAAAAASSKQSKSKKAKRAAAKDDSDASDDEGDSSDESLPSFVPALSLSPPDAIRQLTDTLLSTPPLPFEFLQSAINIEGALHPGKASAAAAAASSASSPLSVHLRRMKDLYERALLSFGASHAELWFSYLCWSRATANLSLTNPNQIYFRASKELRPEHQAEWAELQTMLVQ